MKIEQAKLESVISIKVVKGDGTPENPVRAARVYFLPNGTFIGEVDESAARCVVDDNSFRNGIGGAPVCYDISLNSNSKISKENLQFFLTRSAEKIVDNLATYLQHRTKSTNCSVV